MLHVLKLACPVLKDFTECFSQLLDASCASKCAGLAACLRISLEMKGHGLVFHQIHFTASHAAVSAVSLHTFFCSPLNSDAY